MDLSVGLDICGSVLGTKACASDFDTYFPYEIIDAKLDVSTVCGHHGTKEIINPV